MAITPEIDAPQASIMAVIRVASPQVNVPQGGSLVVYNIPTQQLDATAGLISVAYRQIAREVQVQQASIMVVHTGRIENPRVRAWTFTLDGHDFYVLRLGDRGTLVYDCLTQKWVDWDYADLPFWRPNTGINWIGGSALAYTYGSDILVGDDTFGLLWFLNPTDAFDEHPDPLNHIQQVPFTRVATGQVINKGRDFMPCYAVFLNGDNYGLTAADFTPEVTLDTSDDQGRTFTSRGTLTVQGNPDQDYRWQSLGQIGSPGRMFRITDNGVFARIDSLDMNDDAG